MPIQPSASALALTVYVAFGSIVLMNQTDTARDAKSINVNHKCLPIPKMIIR
ncbi:MAG: hypothetical protein KAX30_04500 [Candidatus Atribacteria bacterium]|nr:hypothetical protein [Candidatus Atribacteria bacterium]